MNEISYQMLLVLAIIFTSFCGFMYPHRKAFFIARRAELEKSIQEHGEPLKVAVQIVLAAGIPLTSTELRSLEKRSAQPDSIALTFAEGSTEDMWEQLEQQRVIPWKEILSFFVPLAIGMFGMLFYGLQLLSPDDANTDFRWLSRVCFALGVFLFCWTIWIDSKN